MRFLILSQYYPPEPIPKPSDLARALARRGHDVEVLTGVPHYPTGQLPDGYRLRFVRRERVDGIPVTRAFEYPYHGTHTPRRILNYATFMLSAPLAALRLGRFDAIYVWHPPLSVGVAAWLVGRIVRAPFLYDVQDIWPDAAVLSGLFKPGPLIRAFGRLERFVYGKAAHLLVVTEGARENLIGKGVPSAKVSVMLQWVDDAAFARPADDEVRAARALCGAAPGEFLVLFTGNIGLVQGLETVLHAARELRHEGIRIALVGDGADRDRLVARSAELDVASLVRFVDRQPASSMPAFMASAEALLVHLRHSELSNYIIPSKTLSYLAAGRPIVMAMEGAAADLVRRAGAGLSVPSENPRALAQALRDLKAAGAADRQAMGARGRAFAERHLTTNALVDKYEELLTRIARPQGKRTARAARLA